MRILLDKLYYGRHMFLVEMDTERLPVTQQISIRYAERLDVKSTPAMPFSGSEDALFTPPAFLRDLYFEEIADEEIQAFCQRFASDTEYRTLALSGAAHWSRRNALFRRNLYSILGPARTASRFFYTSPLVRTFFYWLDQYVDDIMALESYQRVQYLDSFYAPHLAENEVFIKPAVSMLKRIPGIEITTACQGVSATITFQGYQLFPTSEHSCYAYISFSSLSPRVQSTLTRLLPSFPAITMAPFLERSLAGPLLRSTGDNASFRLHVLLLSEYLRAELQGQN